MRVRKKKHTAERIEAQSRFLCREPVSLAADPSAPFPAQGRLRLEIGCGKGSFIVGEAARLPDRNFFAMELISDVIVTAMERLAAAQPPRDNVRFIIGNAKNVGEYFPPRSLETIYINFCDPWPKAGHARRRLTHRNFLAVYSDLLCEGGELRFKTDNVGLFDFTLGELEALGYTTAWVTRDLHASPYAEGNVETEYERNFSEKGFPICALSVCLHR